MISPTIKVKQLEYNPLYAIFSNRYIREFYLRESLRSPSLKNIDREVISTLARNDVVRMNGRRLITGPCIVLYVIGYWTYLSILSHLTSDPIKTIASAMVWIWFIVQAIALSMYERRDGERDAADRFFVAIIFLEQNEDIWGATKFRWEYAARIERMARAVQRIPLSLRRVAPSVRAEFFTISQTRAQATRELESMVIKPGPNTFPELITRLGADLCALIEGRWYDLPAAKYVPQISRLRITIQIVGAAITFTGAIAAITFTSKIGAAAPIVATIFVAMTAALLNFSGIPIATLDKYMQSASNVTSNK
jgi:hypothetical protein